MGRRDFGVDWNISILDVAFLLGARVEINWRKVEKIMKIKSFIFHIGLTIFNTSILVFLLFQSESKEEIIGIVVFYTISLVLYWLHKTYLLYLQKICETSFKVNFYLGFIGSLILFIGCLVNAVNNVIFCFPMMLLSPIVINHVYFYVSSWGSDG